MDSTTDRLACYRCGYDLRATAADGVCPECGEPVAESRRVAALPARPRWAEADPRWRRRILGGVCLLTTVPLMAVLGELDLMWLLPAPLGYTHAVHTLDHTMLHRTWPVLTLSVGLGLLFTAERGRRPSRLDRARHVARRLGLLGAYLILLLNLAALWLVTGMVTIGISALFMSLPTGQQPASTETWASVGHAMVRYGPHFDETDEKVMILITSLAVLLGCVPLHSAIRAAVPRPIVGGALAAVLTPPLILVAVAQAVLCLAWLKDGWSLRQWRNAPYFFDPLIVELSLREADSTGWYYRPPLWLTLIEVAKWLPLAAMLVLFAVAEVHATFVSWRNGRRGALPSPS